jgi:hypothetical protein
MFQFATLCLRWAHGRCIVARVAELDTLQHPLQPRTSTSDRAKPHPHLGC